MDLETQAKLIVTLLLLSIVSISYIIYVYGDNRKVQCIAIISTLLMFSYACTLPEIELQTTFNTTISDKYIEDSNNPFSEKQFYVFEFPLLHNKKEYVNESVYNKYEIGDNYTHVAVCEEW